MTPGIKFERNLSGSQISRAANFQLLENLYRGNMPHRISASNVDLPEPESPNESPPEVGSPEVDLIDPLSGSLKHLSLEIPSETPSVDPESVEMNLFKAYVQ